MVSLPREIKLMELIAEELKIWFRENSGDKNYPSGTVDLWLRNGISLRVELGYLDKVLTWLRVYDHKEIAHSLKQERDSFLSDLQAVEQAIERGDNPPLELIELRSKITGLIGTLEHTAKVFTEKLATEKPAGIEQDNGGQASGDKAGELEPKPPESLQKLLWMLKYGRKHWKLIVLFILILLIFGVFKYLYPF